MNTVNTTTQMFPARHAVLAQFETSALAPFVRSRSVGMLEVMGKPIVHNWLDALKNGGVEDVTIFAGSFAEQLRLYIGRGDRWGFKRVEFVSTSDVSSWNDVLARLDDATAKRSVFASLNAFPVAPLNRLARSDAFWLGDATKKQHGRTFAFRIDTPRDLWQVNMTLVSRLGVDAVEPGSYIDPAARIEKGVCVETRVLIEQQTKLEHCVVGKDVKVASGCAISESLIFSNTALGSHLAVHRMIVDGPLIYQVDSDCIVHVDDAAISTHVRKAGHEITLAERLLAGSLLLLTSPLYLFSRKQPVVLKVFDQEAFDGQTLSRDINLKCIDSASTFARRIPWLTEVIKGNLPLFGVREVGSSVSECPGVISLADFGEQSDMEKLIANEYQRHTYQLKENLALAGSWLRKVIMRSQ